MIDKEKSPLSGHLPSKQKAYVLIRVQPGKEVELYEELKRIPNVAGIDFVHGPWDFIVVAEGNAIDLDRAVLRIRKVPYVLSTETMTVWETFPWEEVSGQLDYGHI